MYFRYGFRGIRFFSSISSRKTTWDPVLSLQLNHPSLVLLEKCNSRNHFKQILAQIMRTNFIGNTFPMSRLILFSSITHPENLDMAMLLFNHFTPNPNVYVYNTMISAVSYSAIESFGLYNSMLRSYVYPDKQTFLYLVKSSKCLSEVKQIHCQAIVTGLLLCNYLQNTIMKVYTENGKFGLAHKLFVQMPEPDVASFNIMIAGYAKKGFSLEALKLYYQMIGDHLEPGEYTMLGLLVCCGQLGSLSLGKSIHAWMERRKSIRSSNLILINALIDMYVKCEELETAKRVFDTLTQKDVFSWNTIIAGFAKLGEMEVAQRIFKQMPKRDLVSWNSLIAGYAQSIDYVSAMKLFNNMTAENVLPDNVTMVNLVSLAAETGDLENGRRIHGWVIRMQMKADAFLGSALIDMYCKCGSIECAIMVFKTVTEKDVTLWTTMMTGLAFHGYGHQAVELLGEMQNDAMPNNVTLISILTACSHSGLVDQGLEIFNDMKEKYGVVPEIEHYGCLVDLLCRSGRLEEAKEAIKKMPMKPSRSIWGSILSGCRAKGDIEMAEMALNELMKLEPEKEGGYVLLSNIYAASGKWSCSDKIREVMEIHGVRKTAGFSSVVVDGAVHSFVAADKQHSRWIEIKYILNQLQGEMKSESEFSLDLLQLLLEI